MNKASLYKTDILHEIKLRDLQHELESWFPYFAGTINMVSYKVLHLRANLDAMYDGSLRTGLYLVSIEEIMSLRAGEFSNLELNDIQNKPLPSGM
jgi:hypothetical protein